MTKFQKKGFTLIELLVVIAIIAILAAILFPVFAQAREKARQTTCLSNEKQIGIGVYMYAQDYDESIVPSQNGGVAGTGTVANPIVSWPTMIYPYIKSAGVFVCPDGSNSASAPNTRYANPAVGAGDNSYVGKTVNTPSAYDTHYMCGDGTTAIDANYSNCVVPALSYSRNLIPGTTAAWSALSGGATATNGKTYPGFGADGTKTGFVGAAGTTATITLSSLADPAGTIHIVDGMTGAKNPTATTYYYGNSMRGLSTIQRTDVLLNSEATKVAVRHTDGFNALFGDGHSHFVHFGQDTPCMWTIQDDSSLCQ